MRIGALALEKSHHPRLVDQFSVAPCGSTRPVCSRATSFIPCEDPLDHPHRRRTTTRRRVAPRGRPPSVTESLRLNRPSSVESGGCLFKYNYAYTDLYIYINTCICEPAPEERGWSEAASYTTTAPSRTAKAGGVERKIGYPLNSGTVVSGPPRIFKPRAGCRSYSVDTSASHNDHLGRASLLSKLRNTRVSLAVRYTSVLIFISFNQKYM